MMSNSIIKKSEAGLTAVAFLACLLLAGGCGVNTRVDDPVSLRSVPEVDRDAGEVEETETAAVATVDDPVAERNVSENDRGNGEAEEVVAATVAAAEDRDYSEILPIFNGVEVRYDDRIGFEAYSLAEDDSAVLTVEGVIRRQFYKAPVGSSPLGIIRYYQRTIADMGGTILFQTRDPQSVEIEEKRLVDYFNKERVNRGMSTYVWDYYRFPRSISEYFSAKISKADADVYIAIAAGRGSGGAEYSGVRFEVVTVVDESGGR